MCACLVNWVSHYSAANATDSGQMSSTFTNFIEQHLSNCSNKGSESPLGRRIQPLTWYIRKAGWYPGRCRRWQTSNRRERSNCCRRSRMLLSIDRPGFYAPATAQAGTEKGQQREQCLMPAQLINTSRLISCRCRTPSSFALLATWQ